MSMFLKTRINYFDEKSHLSTPLKIKKVFKDNANQIIVKATEKLFISVSSSNPNNIPPSKVLQINEATIDIIAFRIYLIPSLFL
jgi:hypothetical protein